MLFVIWIFVWIARAGVLQKNLSLIEMVHSPGASLIDTFAKIYFLVLFITTLALLTTNKGSILLTKGNQIFFEYCNLSYEGLTSFNWLFKGVGDYHSSLNLNTLNILQANRH